MNNEYMQFYWFHCCSDAEMKNQTQIIVSFHGWLLCFCDFSDDWHLMINEFDVRSNCYILIYYSLMWCFNRFTENFRAYLKSNILKCFSKIE